MNNEYTRQEFMALSKEQIASIVKEEGRPRVGVLIPDGTRKIGITCYGLDLNSHDFEETLFKRINEDLMGVVRGFFEHGLHTLFVPCLTNGNLKRNKIYVESAVNSGLRYILQSDEWAEFYRQYKIKVKTYGDLDLLETLGYNQVKDWAFDVQDKTAQNDHHVIYFGIGCSNREEYDRIMDHALEFYSEHGRKPTRDEQINWYYSGQVDDVDFFIRPTIFRDSDIQPPLISGVKTQMYFPIAPFPFLNQNMIREIIFDLLYTRTITYGTDNYSLDDINPSEAEIIKQFYTENSSVIIGLGERVGDFWLPTADMKIPQVLKRNNEKSRGKKDQ